MIESDVDPDYPLPDGHYHIDRDAEWHYVDDEEFVMYDLCAMNTIGNWDKSY